MWDAEELCGVCCAMSSLHWPMDYRKMKRKREETENGCFNILDSASSLTCPSDDVQSREIAVIIARRR